MKEFDDLIEITNRLMAPDGCPWDREQTMPSCRNFFLEEACECIEAIDLEDNEKIKEELGDCLYVAIFSAHVAEREGRFTLQESMQVVKEKLIRRHPHVFGDGEASTPDEVVQRWDEIKKSEKAHAHRKSALDGITKGLPALTYAQKALKKIKKSGVSMPQPPAEELPAAVRESIQNEESLGKLLLAICADAGAKGLDPELALRKKLALLEQSFRENENLV